MSNNAEKMMIGGGAPTAPVANGEAAASGYVHRPPPPSYEESQRLYGTAAANNRAPTQHQLPNSYMSTQPYNNSPQQQPQQQMHMPNYGLPSYTPPPQYYQQHYVAATAPATFNNTKVAREPHVLSLAPGAKIRTTPAGAVSIPPPPPGYAPTAAQYAAMQGQPVVLKKTKRSFF